MLTDLNPPPAEPITLGAAKAFLRVDHDDEDALIQTLITAARERLEAHLNVAMITRLMRLVLPKGGTIKLPRWPVSSVDRVTINGAETQDFAAAFRCRPAQITVPTSEPVEIDFRAGYGVSPDAVPAPLRQALLLIVARGFEHRDGSVGTMPMMVDALTMPYRVVGL